MSSALHSSPADSRTGNLPRVTILAMALFGTGLPTVPAQAQIMISGNETKIDLVSGAPRRVVPTRPDSLSILDFSTSPPTVTHVPDVPNSVIGPPSNIAITPDHSLALIANSIRLDPVVSTNWLPESFVHLLDLRSQPPRIIGRVPTGAQPSGLSITRDGRLALVANRAAGSISVLGIHGQRVEPIRDVPICSPADSVSDVAIAPDGRLVLASVQKAGYLAVLELRGDQLQSTSQKISTYGQPYRVVITPDGQLGLTAGSGSGNRVDRDAITVVDLTSHPVRAVDFLPVGAIPESIEISPDGKLLAAVVMAGSNLPDTDPNHTRHGRLVMLARQGKTFRPVSEHPIGRIPEGVAFSSDGRHVVVQCHADEALWVFSVHGRRVRDTGRRIHVPGWPSSLRVAP